MRPARARVTTASGRAGAQGTGYRGGVPAGGLRPFFGAPACTLADLSVPPPESWCRGGRRLPGQLPGRLAEGTGSSAVLDSVERALAAQARHLAHQPRVSLTYWDAAQDVVTVHATAAWADDAPTRERVWQLFLTTPPPLGYDPGEFWPAGPDDPAFGLFRLRPTRIDITGLASSPAPKLAWRSQ